jgi:hypothetical protein
LIQSQDDDDDDAAKKFDKTPTDGKTFAETENDETHQGIMFTPLRLVWPFTTSAYD